MEKKQTTFEKLSAINVNTKVDKKSNLTYLSWAWAWSETKKACPDATYKIKETEYDDALGFMCHTEVTIEGETLEMWLPVMDGANKSMKKTSYKYTTKYGEKSVEAATSFDVNKTLMRCLVKNLAMFGMGIYIYAGEDLPDTDNTTSTTVSGTSFIEEKLISLELGTPNWNAVVKYVNSNKDLGIEKIGKQLMRKYNISPEVKKEIAKLLK
jgi:hypothetical protein